MKTELAEGEKFLDAEAVAQICGVKKRTVRRWAKLGHVPSIRFGPKLLRFRLRDLEKNGSVSASSFGKPEKKTQAVGNDE